MTSFFPDLNVWLALSVARHVHNAEAWDFLNGVPAASKVSFTRYTQIGLLRLLATESAMGQQVLHLSQAWAVYHRWLEDPRIEFLSEPQGIEETFRDATAPFAHKAASKMVGDCYLLAFAKAAGSTLVTFDRALYALARDQGCPAIRPGQT